MFLEDIRLNWSSPFHPSLSSADIKSRPCDLLLNNFEIKTIWAMEFSITYLLCSTSLLLLFQKKNMP